MTEGSTTPEVKKSNNPQIQEKVESKIKYIKSIRRFRDSSKEELNDRARSQVAHGLLLEKQKEKTKSAEQKVEQATEDALIDPLTGLPNLRSFNNKLKEERERAKRYGGNVSIVIFDLNNLKIVNDTKGHEAGDRYLKATAEALKEGKRIVDFAFRLHGDEFALILPGTKKEGVEAMWKQTLNPKFTDMEISISAGVAEIDPENENDALKMADRALYGAKQKSKETNENVLDSYIFDN